MDGRLKAGHDAGESAGRLANKFILVSNLVAPDDGAAIAAGNGRVVRARLSDARHFWRTDLAATAGRQGQGCEAARPASGEDPLAGVVFHEKLGTLGKADCAHLPASRRACARRLARTLCLARDARHSSPRPTSQPKWSANSPSCRGSWAAITRSRKATEPSVAEAIEDHYKPQGPNDRIPTSPVSIAVALADKLDTLVGFWAIDEKPTGSKDPYALRRAALGVITNCLGE